MLGPVQNVKHGLTSCCQPDPECLGQSRTRSVYEHPRNELQLPGGKPGWHMAAAKFATCCERNSRVPVTHQTHGASQRKLQATCLQGLSEIL